MVHISNSYNRWLLSMVTTVSAALWVLNDHANVAISSLGSFTSTDNIAVILRFCSYGIEKTKHIFIIVSCLIYTAARSALLIITADQLAGSPTDWLTYCFIEWIRTAWREWRKECPYAQLITRHQMNDDKGPSSLSASSSSAITSLGGQAGWHALLATSTLLYRALQCTSCVCRPSDSAVLCY